MVVWGVVEFDGPIRDAIHYQLGERLQFVKSKPQMMKIRGARACAVCELPLFRFIIRRPTESSP